MGRSQQAGLDNSTASIDLAQIAKFFDPPLLSTISTPLLSQDKLLGVVTAYSPRLEGFKDRDCYSLEQVSISLSKRILAFQLSVPTKVVPFVMPRT